MKFNEWLKTIEYEWQKHPELEEIYGPRTIDKLIGRIHVLTKALEDANDMCRSAYQVSERSGVQTNWSALTDELSKSLERQFRVLHEDE